MARKRETQENEADVQVEDVSVKGATAAKIPDVIPSPSTINTIIVGSEDEVLNAYNQDQQTLHEEKFNRRNVYNEDVANAILGRTKGKDVKSRPIAAAMAMIDVAGRDKSELKAIIEDQLLNAKTEDEETFWSQAKEDYAKMSSAELKASIEGTENTGIVEEFQDLHERQQEYDEQQEEFVEGMMDDYIDGFVENYGTNPTEDEMNAARDKFEKMFGQNNPRPKYKKVTITRGGDNSIKSNLEDKTNINTRRSFIQKNYVFIN